MLAGPTQRGKTILLDGWVVGWVAGKSKNISNSEITEQAGAELSQAQSQLGLRMLIW